MKKALLVLALLVAPFLSQANDYTIFHDAQNGIKAPTDKSCDIGGQDPNQFAIRHNEQNNKPRWIGTTEWQGAATLSGVEGVDYLSSTQCRIRYKIGWTVKKYNQAGEQIDEYRSYDTYNMYLYGNVVYAPSCTYLDVNQYPDHIYQGENADGEPYCFTAQDLSDVATCDVNSPWLPVGSNNSQFQCLRLPDQSRCRYEMKTANGQSWLQPTAEPDDCFTGNGTPYQAPSPDVEYPEGDTCQDIGNGTIACPENPANVCNSNGVCQSGCGTVVFGGESQFICLSSDTDGDGLGDYADPDIDGDGIRNEDDLDVDGDGQEDPNYIGNIPPSGELSNVEYLLGQIANNTRNNSSGGGSGSGPTANQIGAAVGSEVGEEISERLTELADFSTSDYEQSVDNKIQQSEQAIDQFLSSDENDLTKAFDSNDFENSFTDLKNVFTNTGCTAQFSIPFTSKTLDLCEPASKAQPFLYVIFAISTFIYCVRRVQQTARSE